MIKPIFKIDGKVVSEPLNYQQLSLELNFDKDSPSYRGQVSTNEWTIGVGEANNANDGVKAVLNYISEGTGGGVGVFEGCPFEISLSNNGSTDVIFDGFLDLSEASITCDTITATSVECGRIDWLNQVADSFTFEYLYDALPVFTNGLPTAGKISSGDFVPVPYVLSSVPDTQQILTLSISIFVINQELGDTIKEWQEWSLAFTSDYLEFGNLVTLIVLTIKNILLMIALVKLIKDLISVTIQPIKYHSSMYLYDLCVKGSEYLGLNFSSTILETVPFNQVVCIPQSYRQFENLPNGRSVKDLVSKHIFGVTDLNKVKLERVGFFRGTFGDLLRELKTMFNAKLVMDGDTLRLERVDYKQTSNPFRIPNVDKIDVPFRFNFDDLKSFYSISFTPDLNDKNTYQNYFGTELQVITSPKKFNDRRKLLTKGSQENRIGFARGKRKTELTFVERYINEFLNDIARIAGIAEKGMNGVIAKVNILLVPINKLLKDLRALGIKLKTNVILVPPVRLLSGLQAVNMYKRLNMLSIENDFIQVPKLVLLNTDRGKVTPELVRVQDKNNEIINANYLWENFHSINSFAYKNTGEHNQYKIYTLSDIPFCIADYNKVKNNNLILDSDGITKAEVISLKWNIYRQTAEINYKVKELYTTNLKEDKIFSDGR